MNSAFFLSSCKNGGAACLQLFQPQIEMSRGNTKARNSAIRANELLSGVAPFFSFAGILLPFADDLIFTPDLLHSNLSPSVVLVTPRGLRGTASDLEASIEANKLSGWVLCASDRRDHSLDQHRRAVLATSAQSGLDVLNA